MEDIKKEQLDKLSWIYEELKNKGKRNHFDHGVMLNIIQEENKLHDLYSEAKNDININYNPFGNEELAEKIKDFSDEQEIS